MLGLIRLAGGAGMRARNIKPGFFRNEELAELNPLTRILFAGLWCLSDREGRLEDRPKRIKADILPYDNCNIDKLLNELQDNKFILRYEIQGNQYIQVLNFKKHQNPHVREPESEIPAPDLHSAKPVQEPEEHGSGPADSPSLIPDSGFPFPDSPILESGAADAVPYVEIVDYLNLKCFTNFKPTTRTTKEHIRARWREGFKLDAFKAVIENKARDWINDAKMSKFLRPDTLFGTKFESYLNQKETMDVPSAWNTLKPYLEGVGVSE
jgi:uncharacterized phage protein (TIGR02220 family)